MGTIVVVSAIPCSAYAFHRYEAKNKGHMAGQNLELWLIRNTRSNPGELVGLFTECARWSYRQQFASPIAANLIV